MQYVYYTNTCKKILAFVILSIMNLKFAILDSFMKSPSNDLYMCYI